ncbi:DUF664 domain-containing protein [Nonomuraea sp. NPDC026600]|uniref:mycothiol transferase n=1 Tax=Nonomuraea sp. NPDC026600 TaxID=3155363 RepID=UPI0033D4BC29
MSVPFANVLHSPVVILREPSRQLFIVQSERALSTAILPSGWTVLGLVEHLGYAERHWFQEIVTGSARHASHLDVVRELLDGNTGLGPR